MKPIIGWIAGSHLDDLGKVSPKVFNGRTGNSIDFEEEGFSVRDCIVNGKKRNLAKYVAEVKVDTRLPLVADYNGTKVNVASNP